MRLTTLCEYKDINDYYDEQIDRVEQSSQDRLDALEEQFSEINIAKMVAEAMRTGLIEVDGEIVTLQTAIEDFINNSAEGFSVMGDVIRNEMIANLQVATDTLKNYESVMKDLGITDLSGNVGGVTTNSTTNTINTGNITVTVTTQTNADPQEIAKEVDKAVQNALKDIVQGL